jgi:hypothetical protein
VAGVTEVIDQRPSSDPDAPTAVGERRVVDRLDPRLVNVLTALGFGLPLAGYLWAIWKYSVNVIISDQLNDVTVVKASKSHLLPWGALWTQDNEERMFFPRLLTILLVHTDHLNIRFEDFLGATMLIIAIGLFIWAHKRRSPSTPWLYYCPVAFLGFSLVQYENALWGYQSDWYLALLALAVAMVLLDRIALGWLVFIAAVAAAVVGSFSSIQGLIIWPTGLVLLYHRRRAAPFIYAWVAMCLVSVLLYFYKWNTRTGAPDHTYAIHHLWAAVKFYLYNVGDVVGIPVSIKTGAGNNNVLLFGLVILIIAVATLVVYGIRRDEHGGAPVGVALICYGLLFAASTTEGRTAFGYFGASASRYTTFDLLILIGIYLTLLGRPAMLEAKPDAAAPLGELPSPSLGRRASPVIALALPAARWIVAGAIVVQVLLGVQHGIQGSRDTHKVQEEALQVSRNLNDSSNGYLRYFVDPYEPGTWIRQQLQTAEKLHIGEYANSGHSSGASQG